MDVYLVDGTYELFRHYYALPSARDDDGREVAAVRGVLSSMLGMIRGGATHIAVATDHVIESFRNELWAGYKTSEGVEPKDSGRRLRSPAAHARIPVSGIAHQRQVIRDRLRRNTKFLDYTRLVQRNARPPVQLNDPRAPHALGKVLIWCAQNHSFDARIASSQYGCGRQGIISLELHHRPDNNACRRQHALQDWKLRQQIRASMAIWNQFLRIGVNGM